MLSIFGAIFQFARRAIDPHQGCTITDRNAGVAGPYYVHSQMTGDVGVI